MKDVEAALAVALTAAFPAARVCTETPGGDEFVESLPIIRVVRSGGDSTWTVDNPIVDVDVFAPTRDASRKLAELVRDWFNDLRRQSVGGVSFTLVKPLMAPRWLPWGDTIPAWRFGASYALTCA